MKMYKELQRGKKTNCRAVYQRALVLGIIAIGIGFLFVGIAGTNSILAITGFGILFLIVCADP